MVALQAGIYLPHFPMFIAAGICEKSEPLSPWQGTAALTINREWSSIMADKEVARRVWVYKITCTANGKIYFGITRRSISERWSQHKTMAANPKHCRTAFLHALRHHGADAFVVEEVMVAFSEKDAAMLERHLISEYGTMSPGGYNTSEGGELFPGRTLSAEHKAKIAAAGIGRQHTPETKAKMRASRLGYRMSDESRAKLSATRMGMKWSSESRAKASASHKGRPWTPEFRATMEQIQNSPEYRAKMRAAHARRNQRDAKGQGELL